MGRGNESLFTGSWSHDLNGRHTHTEVPRLKVTVSAFGVHDKVHFTCII